MRWNPFDFTLYYGNEARKDMEIMNKQLVERKGEIKYTTDNDGSYTFAWRKTHHEVVRHARKAKDYGILWGMMWCMTGLLLRRRSTMTW